MKIDVIILDDGLTAKSKIDRKLYKIKSILLGAGRYQKSIPWSKYSIKPKTECVGRIIDANTIEITPN